MWLLWRGDHIAPFSKYNRRGVVEAFVDTSIDDNLLAVPILNPNQDIREKITFLITEGYQVDDDNVPAPKNILTTSDRSQQGVNISWQPRGSQTVCHRQAAGHRFKNPKLLNQPNTSNCMEYFLYFLTPHVRQVVLVDTNNHLEGRVLAWGEFVKYIGLWLLLLTVLNGCSRKSFWDEQPPSEWSGAPFRFHKYMSYTRFENMMKALQYSNTPSPQYVDKFSEVRDLIKEWNMHMQWIFIPSWMSCLDESMSSWTRWLTCPGFMYIPRKPHPMGNGYH